MTDNQRYFTLLTDKGKFKIAKAAADKGEVKFSHFAIGDGGGQEVNPTPNQTALVHEVWRAQLDSVEIDPKNPAAVIINAIIPHNVGGWWMREFGLFDVDGDMLAVVKPAPYYKATSAEGQLEDVYYEFQLVIGEQAQVVVLVDPSILWATREYVETRRISAGQMMNKPWFPCKALDVATPPSSNNQGDTYVIPTGAKGDWADKIGQLAEWNGKKWNFIQTPDGHGIGLPDGSVYIKIGGKYILPQNKIIGFCASGSVSLNIPSSCNFLMKNYKLIEFDTEKNFNNATGSYNCPFDGYFTISGWFWFADIPGITKIYLQQNNDLISEQSMNARGRVLSVTTTVEVKKGDQLRMLLVQEGGTTMTTNDQYRATCGFSGIFAGTTK